VWRGVTAYQVKMWRLKLPYHHQNELTQRLSKSIKRRIF
jgi:hypothetical protein